MPIGYWDRPLSVFCWALELPLTRFKDIIDMGDLAVMFVTPWKDFCPRP